jgi:diaminopimelate epimerase
MIKLEFYKICCAGNDFIVVDNRKKLFNAEYQENLVEMLCARNYAIGADGVCFIETSTIADYSVKFFSADGAESDFSVNGIRAAMRFAEDKEIAGNSHSVETRSGVVKGEITEEIVGTEIPAVKKIDLKHELEIPHQFESRIVEASYIDFGTKQLVFKIEKIATFDVKGIGAVLSGHTQYQPQGIDVSFYDVIDGHNINVATYAVGIRSIVHSSGNGAASCVALAEARHEVSSPVIVNQAGGLLKVSRKGATLFIEGEARVAFTGYITSDMLNFDIEKIRKKQTI